MRLIFATIYVLIFSIAGNAQEFIHQLPGKYDFFRIDNLGNLLLTQGEDIVKLNPDFKQEARNSNKLFGPIHEIDGTNALKIILFNKELSQLSILDNKLFERGKSIPLEKFGFEQVSAVAASYNNGIWLFDQVLFELFRLDQQMEVNLRSGSTLQLLKLAIHPQQMQEYGKWLYLNDPELGVFVFDIFGTYYKRIPITGIQRMQFSDDGFVFLKEGLLYEYNWRETNSAAIFPNLSEIQDFALHKNRLYLHKKREIFVYKF